MTDQKKLEALLLLNKVLCYLDTVQATAKRVESRHKSKSKTKKDMTYDNRNRHNNSTLPRHL